MSHQNYANKTYLHIHTVLAALSSSFNIVRQIQRSATTRMESSACQNGGYIYINYFNKKIYIHPFLLADVFLLLRGFRLLAFDTLHTALIFFRKPPKPAPIQGSCLARCPAK
jgi:hypothetical protein